MTIWHNGEPREVADGTTVAAWLSTLDTSRHVAVEVNEEVVPRARHGEWRLRDGDRVEVVSLVGGG